MIKKIRYIIEYLLVRGLTFFVNLLPERGIGIFASAIGFLWYRVDSKHRRIAMTNINYAFPEMSELNRERIVKESFKNTITIFATFPMIAGFNNENLYKTFDFQGEANYIQAKNRGKGVFILTCHLGNWEFTAAVHSIKYNGLVAVAKDIHNPYINKYIKAMRSSAFIDVVRPRNSVFKLLRDLRQGKTIVMLLDQNTMRHEAVFVNFFGRPAATQYAMALMALKTGAAVVPVFIIKNPVRHGYTIKYEKPIIPADGKDRDVVKWTQEFTDVLERRIKSMPAQWLWVHNRFKTTPSEDSDAGDDTGQSVVK